MKKIILLGIIGSFFLFTAPGVQAETNWFQKLFFIFSQSPFQYFSLEKISSELESEQAKNSPEKSEIPAPLPPPPATPPVAETVVQTISAPLLASCRELRNEGFEVSGVYQVDPDGAGDIESFLVYCDMETVGGGWTLVARRTESTRLNIGLATPESKNILNAHTKDILFSSLQERFDNKDITRTYNIVRGKLSEPIVDVQAFNIIPGNWVLDVYIGEVGFAVDNFDDCDTNLKFRTAATNDPTIGFAWQSYQSCSELEGFYGYGHVGNRDDFRMEYFTGQGGFKNAELWIR